MTEFANNVAIIKAVVAKELLKMPCMNSMNGKQE